MDTRLAKLVMKGMSSEQQALTKLLLNSLRDEQRMRLQSEEQYETMMRQTLQNQSHLETQLKMAKAERPGSFVIDSI